MKADAHTEAELLAILDQFGQAFAKRDVAGVFELFVPDSDLVFMGSEEAETAVGWDEFKLVLERIFSRPEAYMGDG